jgi:hypothetical protein
MTTYTITQEQIDDAVELLVTSLHHIPLDDLELMADAQVMIGKLRSLTPNSGEPFGIWHPAEDPDECEFFLYSESGAVSCPNCILLFTHPAPSTKPADALKRDAERYRWIKRPDNASLDTWTITLSDGRLDAAIDAAMIAAAPQGETK